MSQIVGTTPGAQRVDNGTKSQARTRTAAQRAAEDDVMKIGITIGDNDFQRTIEAFLRLFYDSRVIMDAEYCCHGNLLQDCGATHRGTVEPVTKEQIILMWNHLKVGLYLLVQRGFRTYAGNPPLEEDLVSIEKYLTLRNANIFIDDEVTAYIAKNELTDNFNYAFSWVDTISGAVTTR